LAQYLKDEVARRICAAALSTFAEQGFDAASVAQIARLASVSTGNVYRYFENKGVLFRAVVPPVLARRLLALLRARVRSAKNAVAEAALRTATEELLAFSIRHRLEVVILLQRSEGTLHEGFAENVEKLMTRLAVLHYRGAEREPLDSASASVLALVYRGWIRAMAQILIEQDDEDAIRQRVACFTQYHLSGLDAFFRALDDALASGVP
jgi:AcrR family transcriptional regulator